jgi:thiosulfate/3-mercaptopyruvate sulfurtransferase
MAQTETKQEYPHPEALVDTQWIEDHLEDEKVRIAEVDYDPTSNYELVHIPGSVLIKWKSDINNPVTRDILSKEAFEALLHRIGVNNDTTLALYGDFNNWFAAFAFWVFKHYGFDDVRLVNGGRKKWLLEDRPLTKDIQNYANGNYKVTKEPNKDIRVYLDYVRKTVGSKSKSSLVDVRSSKEFTGEITAPAEYPTEHAQRGGHIPGAKNIPWAQAVNDGDGTFKSVEELRKLYEAKGITPDKEIITYCRIGERSSHTWFVLKYLLGYPNVKNYDGSWTEWGNLIANPIEK